MKALGVSTRITYLLPLAEPGEYLSWFLTREPGVCPGGQTHKTLGAPKTQPPRSLTLIIND